MFLHYIFQHLETMGLPPKWAPGHPHLKSGPVLREMMEEIKEMKNAICVVNTETRTSFKKMSAEVKEINEKQDEYKKKMG